MSSVMQRGAAVTWRDSVTLSTETQTHRQLPWLCQWRRLL